MHTENPVGHPYQRLNLHIGNNVKLASFGGWNSTGELPRVFLPYQKAAPQSFHPLADSTCPTIFRDRRANAWPKFRKSRASKIDTELRLGYSVPRDRGEPSGFAAQRKMRTAKCHLKSESLNSRPIGSVAHPEYKPIRYGWNTLSSRSTPHFAISCRR